MSPGDKYKKIVEWSDEDGCFVGTCPELFFGGCHGPDPRAVFDELCDIVEESIEIYRAEGRPLPPALSAPELLKRIA